MKRCPECRRDYYDDSLLYCLDDGTALLEGPGSDRINTAILPSDRDSQQITEILARRSAVAHESSKRKWLLPSVIAMVALISGFTIFWFGFRDSRQNIKGSFREIDSPAYDYYLRGKLDSVSQNRDRNQNAIKVLEEVVAADPGFAPAYASLSRAYAIKADLFAQQGQQRKLYDDAKLAAEKALAIDPSLAEAHLALGASIWNHMDRFPHEQSIHAYKKAIALDPDNEEAHHLLGLVYYHIGLFDKSESELKKATELNPSHAMARFRLGQVAALRTDYERALSLLKTVPREANAMVIDRTMASLLFQLGRTDEAWKVIDNFLSANSDEGGNVTSVKAMLLAKAGRGREAEEAIRQAVEIGRTFQHFHHATYNIASAYAILDNRDEAMKWLQFTADEGFPCYPLFEKDKTLENLWEDDRFKAFMRGLKQDWERRNTTL
jgi:tetratricopeptide (TPR) repeat protein